MEQFTEFAWPAAAVAIAALFRGPIGAAIRLLVARVESADLAGKATVTFKDAGPGSVPKDDFPYLVSGPNGEPIARFKKEADAAFVTHARIALPMLAKDMRSVLELIQAKDTRDPAGLLADLRRLLYEESQMARASDSEIPPPPK